MLINYNIEELKCALNDFYQSTGTAIALMDSDFNMIVSAKKESDSFCGLIQLTDEGKKCCLESDCAIMKKCAESRKLELHTCHAGLIDAAVPINYNDSVIGYIVLGQMRFNIEFKDVYSRISGLGIDFKKAEKAYQGIPISSEEKIKSVSNIAVMLTQYILFKNMITHQQNPRLTEAIIYISEHISEDLSIQSICEKLNISKNVLYRAFRKYMNCTVGEYINSKRIEYAKSLLVNSDRTLQQISEQSGFTEYTYFCKIFKKLVGVTPYKYKKYNS